MKSRRKIQAVDGSEDGAALLSQGWLLRLENETGHGYAVETRDGTLVPLDGSVAQINFANEIAGLRLDIGNALAYAVFFARFW